MNHDVIISCAVTGDDTKVTKSPHCAITPEQIAATAVEAAQAGAAIVHIHVRDPETGAFSMETKYYREVVKRIREAQVDVIVNLTCGMGGYIVVGEHGLKDTPAPGSDFVTQEERMRHVIDLCHEGNVPAGHRHPRLRKPEFRRRQPRLCLHAQLSAPGRGDRRDLEVKPELEVFDTGNLWFVKQMVKEGLLEAPSLIQLCMGIPYGVPADVGHLLAMVNALPENCNWGSFAISRMQMPWVAQSILLGGNVRVGLEDNLYLSKGVYASNAQLVEKARTIIEAMGARILTPAQARDRLKLH